MSPSDSGSSAFSSVQVQRVELKNKLEQNYSIDEHLSGVRHEVSKGVKQLDELLESTVQFVETSLAPFEEQLPPSVTKVTTKAFDQAREVRGQIRERVVPASFASSCQLGNRLAPAPPDDNARR